MVTHDSELELPINLRSSERTFYPASSGTEQCVQRNSPLFINFVDFRKVFDSVHRESLWNIMAIPGIPGKLITMVKLFYNNFMCSVEHDGRYSDWFVIKSGVRQGFVIFLLVIDWKIATTTKRGRGINWGRFQVLEDLDHADDLSLLSDTCKQIQLKTNELVKSLGKSGSVGEYQEGKGNEYCTGHLAFDNH
ncbi:uncharacterized protein [Montipora foliosa]|uniref:uncharacterized protein n=1 Tax=Montipora foliosa TaxID=591990 RepID=UPI0035F1D2F8